MPLLDEEQNGRCAPQPEYTKLSYIHSSFLLAPLNFLPRNIFPLQSPLKMLWVYADSGSHPQKYREIVELPRVARVQTLGSELN